MFIIIAAQYFIMRILTKLITSTLAVMIATYILPGVHVDNVWMALLVAIVLALLNTFIKPLLVLFTLPFTIFTFGLFLLVINALIILLADKLVDGFHVNGFWWALFFSAILSLITWLLESIADPDSKQ
jgi:putative membrane protein